MPSIGNDSPSLRWYFTLLIGIFLSFFIISYFLPLLSYQEARRALLIQESYLMSFPLQTYNGEPYFTKPPLHTWISLLFYSIGSKLGIEVFAMRLPSLLSYLFIAYILYLLYKKNLSKTLLSLLILFSSYRFLSFVYRIDLEPLFILFNFASFYFLWSYLEKPSTIKILLFYFFFACAFLVRGPLHLFLIPAYLSFALYFKDKDLLKLLFHPLGLILFLALTSPWYVYGYTKFGKEVFQEFLIKDVQERIAQKRDPFYYYIKAYFLNFLPFFILILLKFKEVKAYFKERADKFLKLTLFALFIPLILLSLTGKKFDKYILFLYPFSALWMTEILCFLYQKQKKLIFIFVSFLTTLNFLFITSISLTQSRNIKTQIPIFLHPLLNLSQQKLAFYQRAHPLVLYSFKKTLPVLKEREKVEEALKEGYWILSPVLIKDLTYRAVLQDPYKKGEFWYLYKNPLFSEN